MSGEGVVVTHKCLHCGDPVGELNGSWVHIHEKGNGSKLAEHWDDLVAGRVALWRCQHTVPYGQNAEQGEPV